MDLQLPPSLYVLVSLFGAAVVLTWRFRETSAPVTTRSLLIPPVAMSTGLFMFLAPQTRVPVSWALVALALGAFVFSWPLARSSKLTREGEHFLMKRSPLFGWILLGLLAVRFALRSWVEAYVSQLQTGALFFLLAFGAIVRWRVSMLLQLRRLRAAA
ncbi:MAG: cytochrome c biogenesis protein CcdC [Archangium sp.]|nr:cytochrome c biogenesis protein CcdC [Archangium sp.]